MHTVDFLSQDFFQQLGSGRSRLPDDALQHEILAEGLRRAATRLPAGSVIAIEGSWGRGKTDLLARVAAPTFAEEEDDRPQGLAREAVWLNPWGYGSADLLTPLVTELGRRVAKKGSLDRKTLEKIAATVIQAGVAFGIKGAASVVPVGGAILEQTAVPISKLVAGFFEPKPDAPDLDAVAAMASRFRELVDASLSEAERAHGARLLVCIDDLDRCLPDRQVALLQAVRFLLSAGAAATFVVAIDPTLAREAVRTHYQSRDFDVERYLDKMFDLRISMRGLPVVALQSLAMAHMERQVVRSVREESLGEVVEAVLGIEAMELAEGLAEALSTGGQANPRVLRRVVDRLAVLVLNHTEEGALFRADNRPSGVLTACWLLICDREPELRRALQRAGIKDNWEKAVHQADSASKTDNPKNRAAAWLASKGMPAPEECRTLLRLLPTLQAMRGPSVGPQLAQLDRALAAQGL